MSSELVLRTVGNAIVLELGGGLFLPSVMSVTAVASARCRFDRLLPEILILLCYLNGFSGNWSVNASSEWMH